MEKPESSSPRFNNRWEQFEWHVKELLSAAECYGRFELLANYEKEMIYNTVYGLFASALAKATLESSDKEKVTRLVYDIVMKMGQPQMAAYILEQLKNAEIYARLMKEAKIISKLCVC
jgi:hypothetical protein